MLRKTDPENYIKFLQYMSINWNRKTGIPANEFEAEGWYAYAKAIRNHDPSRPFKPYLKALAYHEMKRYAKKFSKFYTVEVDSIASLKALPDTEAQFKMSLESLSIEASEVVRVVLNCPDELLSIVRSKKGRPMKRQSIREYFKSKGWSHKIITSSFKEIAEIWI